MSALPSPSTSPATILIWFQSDVPGSVRNHTVGGAKEGCPATRPLDAHTRSSHVALPRSYNWARSALPSPVKSPATSVAEPTLEQPQPPLSQTVGYSL